MVKEMGKIVLVSGLMLGIVNPSEAVIAPASYVIYKGGTTYYAQNGQTGVNDYSGTAAATVIQSAIDNLSANGGAIFLKEATYEVTTNITIPSQKPVSLKGVNPASTVIKYTGTQSSNGLLKLQGSSTAWIEDVTVENLTLDCNSLIQYGYWANYLRRATVRNCIVKGHKQVVDWGIGIVVGVRDGGITIENCRVLAGSGTSTGGIWITNPDEGDNRTLVHGNFVEGQNVGIFLEDRVKKVIVEGNSIKDCTEGIRTAGLSTNPVEYIDIVNNHVYNCSSNGILVGDVARYVNVVGNIVDGGGYGIYARNLSESVIANNVITGSSNRGIESSSLTNVVINGNNVYGANNDGIGVLDGCKTVLVNGNTIVGSGTMGIRVHNAGGGVNPSNIVVIGNNVKNNGRLATYHCGIYLGNVTDCIVGNNRSYDDQATKTQDYGIQEAGSSNYNIIVGNDARGNKSSDIVTVGQNDVIRHNLGYFNELQVGEVTGINTATTGIKSGTITFGSAYPTGKTPTITLTLKDPSSTSLRFNDCYVTSVSNTGFTYNVVVMTAASGSTVKLQWAAQLP